MVIPCGDGRSIYRFFETLGHGSIPVLISDGLSLPYEELIPKSFWKETVVRIPERLFKNEYSEDYATPWQAADDFSTISHEDFERYGFNSHDYYERTSNNKNCRSILLGNGRRSYTHGVNGCGYWHQQQQVFTKDWIHFTDDESSAEKKRNRTLCV